MNIRTCDWQNDKLIVISTTQLRICNGSVPTAALLAVLENSSVTAGDYGMVDCAEGYTPFDLKELKDGMMIFGSLKVLWAIWLLYRLGFIKVRYDRKQGGLIWLQAKALAEAAAISRALHSG